MRMRHRDTESGTERSCVSRVSNPCGHRQHGLETRDTRCTSLCLCLCVAFLLCVSAFAEPAPPPVSVQWLDRTPPTTTQGVSWGVPWPRGAVAKGAMFRLTDGKGGDVPAQSWPTAYWPDGSLKWTGHAIAATPQIAGRLSIA